MSEAKLVNIEENIKRIKKDIPEEVVVLAATKGRKIEEIEEAIKAGIQILGENYVQEASDKFLKIGKKAKWHFIGHLQTNKVKKALDIFDCIQTLDSIRLAQALERRACFLGKTIPILIEVNPARYIKESLRESKICNGLNIAKVTTKYGISEDRIWELVEEVNKLSHLRLDGLMTMEPYSQRPEDSRFYFRRLRQIFGQLKKDARFAQMKILSMGMSRTYQVAIEEGANLIRLGEAIFGPRD